MSGEIDYRRYAGRPSPMPNYLSDSLTPWYGYWHPGGGVATLDYTNLPGGACFAKVVITTDAALRFRYVGFRFAVPQNIVNSEISFKYKFSRNEAVGHSMWITTLGSPYAVPTLEHPVGLPSPSPTTWTLFSSPVSTFRPSASSPRLQNDSMASVAKYFYMYGFTFSGPTTMEIACFNIRRLP